MSKKIKVALANLQKAYLAGQAEQTKSKEVFLDTFLAELTSCQFAETEKALSEKSALFAQLAKLEEFKDYFVLFAALEIFSCKEELDVSPFTKLFQSLIALSFLPELGGKVKVESCRLFTLELFYYFSSLLLKTDNYAALHKFLTHSYSQAGKKVNYTYLSNQQFSVLSTREIARFINAPERRNKNFSESDFPEVDMLLFYASAFASLYLLPSWQRRYASQDFKIKGSSFLAKLVLPSYFEKMKNLFMVGSPAEFIKKAKLVTENIDKTSRTSARYSAELSC